MRNPVRHQPFCIQAITSFSFILLFICIAPWQAAQAQRAPYMVRDLSDSSTTSTSSNPREFMEAGEWIYCTNPGGILYGEDQVYRTKSLYWMNAQGKSGSVSSRILPSNFVSDVLGSFGDYVYFTTVNYILGYGGLNRIKSPTSRTEYISSADQLESIYSASAMAAGGTDLYFIASGGNTGQELWKTDGLSTGAILVKDIYPGSGGSDIKDPLWVNGALYFWANDGVQGRELWATNGTSATTRLVEDIAEGSKGSYVGNAAGASSLIPWNNKVVFAAKDAFDTTYLWQTDGTDSGTTAFHSPEHLAGLAASDKAIFFFQRILPGADCEFWKSDGTASGTLFVKRFEATSFQSPKMTCVAGNLFFVVQEKSVGTELWMSDGTPAGTKIVGDIRAGTESSSSSLPVEWQGALYFHADDGVHGRELWRCDRNGANLRLVKDIAPGSAIDSAAEMAPLAQFLIFAADDGLHGEEPWVTDGTEGGTKMLCDLNGAAQSSYFSDLVGIQNRLMFTLCPGANGAGSGSLWRSEGLANNTGIVTNKVAPIDSVPSSQGIDRRQFSRNVNGQLFFSGVSAQTGQEIWKSDGTDKGTALVKDIAPGAAGIDIRSSAASGSLFYFRKRGGGGLPQNDELWRSDGTANGTFQVKAGNLDSSSTLAGAGDGQGALCFVANDPLWGKELWLSDGTAAGTQRATTITSATNHVVYPEAFFWKGAYYFVDKKSDGWRLRRLNMPGKTMQIIQILNLGLPLSTDVQSVDAFTPVGNQLFFRIDPLGSSNNTQIWKTDGTSAGTTMVTSATSVVFLAEFKGDCFFEANSQFSNGHFLTSSLALWRTDGTRNGTVMVKEISEEFSPGGPVLPLYPRLTPSRGFGSRFGVADGILYFAVTSEWSGVNPWVLETSSVLWMSDGTAGGTKPCEISPGFPLRDAHSITKVGESLFCIGNDGQHGDELWRIAPFGITRAATWGEYN